MSVPGYTVDEARLDAREWSKGVALDGSSRGWRVCCAMLDARIAELEAALHRIAAPTYGTELHDTDAERAAVYWSHLQRVQQIAREAVNK